MDSSPIPLHRRPMDIALLAFFLVNLLFITYVVDLEQLVIPDPANFRYPAWPPPAAVDLIHNYGRTLDPDLMARPAWWKMTIWIDVLFFGPFYVAAIYAFIKGREWIRIPSIIYGSMIITNVLIILSEERFGATPAPNFPIILLLNAPWLLFPAALIYRMARASHPFLAAGAGALPTVYPGGQNGTGLQDPFLENEEGSQSYPLPESTDSGVRQTSRQADRSSAVVPVTGKK